MVNRLNTGANALVERVRTMSLPNEETPRWERRCGCFAEQRGAVPAAAHCAEPLRDRSPECHRSPNNPHLLECAPVRGLR